VSTNRIARLGSTLGGRWKAPNSTSPPTIVTSPMTRPAAMSRNGLQCTDYTTFAQGGQ
jgi:hypothetical protein